MNKNFKVNYLARDFFSIRDELKKYASRYYSNTMLDLSDASINSFLIESAAYVGDVLSYYLDFQTNETFLTNAVDITNVNRLAKSLGYKRRDNASTYGRIMMFMLLPAKQNSNGPDFSKAPIIKKGSEFTTDSGIIFTSTEDVKINQNSVGNNYIISRTNAAGNPTYYAVKVSIPIVSGRLKTTRIEVGNFIKFNKIALEDNSIAEVIRVTDSQNNEYYEVPTLVQNIVYRSVLNSDSDPLYILKPISAQRRFVFEKDETGTYLIFGGRQHRPDDDITADPVAEPTKFILNKYNNDYITDNIFDPNVLLNNDNYGLGPDNTTLSIYHRVNNSSTNDALLSEINKVSNLLYDFDSSVRISSHDIDSIINSIQVVNEESIVGQSDNPDINEIKDLAGQIFNSQGRAVTAKDYETLVYMMPSKYGFIKRVKAIRDPNSLKNNINLYISCIDKNNMLAISNSKIKQNIKTWLLDYKIITDTVDIMDAKVINFGIEYTVRVDPAYSKSQVLDLIKQHLRYYFSFKPQIGQSLSILDIFREIRKIDNVLDVVNIKVVNKVGDIYPGIYFNVKENTSSDGNFIKIPKNAIYEVRYLDERTPDIIGIAL